MHFLFFKKDSFLRAPYSGRKNFLLFLLRLTGHAEYDGRPLPGGPDGGRQHQHGRGHQRHRGGRQPRHQQEPPTRRGTFESMEFTDKSCLFFILPVLTRDEKDGGEDGQDVVGHGQGPHHLPFETLIQILFPHRIFRTLLK